MLSRRKLSPLVFLVCSNVVLASLPLVNFAPMGTVGLAGSFAGLGFSDNTSSSLSFDSSTSSLLLRASDGSLSNLGSTNTGGEILSGCALDDTFYFAGSFSSINGTSASNVASYTPSSGALVALASGGPDGEVHAVFCETTQKKVWVGGSFSSPAPSVAVWDPSASSWSAPPFGGLANAASEVLSITTNASQASLFFAGSFITTFGNTTGTLNNTNNPNVPFSAGATPFSSSLVPIPLQRAQIVASPSSTNSQFSNITDVLCPTGSDGPGETWFAADGNQAVITIRAFASLSTSGIRIGNTFLDGRGTTGFKVTIIPDNVVQTLHYIDPTTGANATCSNPCPLLTDSSIPYQDFLFADATDITGLELTLLEWTGAGPGLHLLQVLSSGAFASAVETDNEPSCFAPNPSNATHTGQWTEKDVNTGIAGTTQAVLVSTVDVGTSSDQAPTFTWMPYVSASGQYDINMLIPGCENFEDCGLRTSVKVIIFPGGGQAPTVITVSQQNQQDTVTQLYSGPIVPTSQTFVTTIEMTLADEPEGTGQNGQYELVADRVQLILTSANVTNSTGTASSNVSSSAQQRGFGFFEWPLSASPVSATSTLSNLSLTSLDAISVDLLTALGGVNNTASLTTSSISAVAHHSSGTIFLGGQFTLNSGASNIVAFKGGALQSLSHNGLNGAVTSLQLEGDTLYVGGGFSDTSSASTSGKLRGVAIYDVQLDTWSPLDAGVDGAVASLDLSNDQLLVAGNFTNILSSTGDNSNQNTGFATWNITSSSWVPSGGFLVGSMSFVGNSTAPSKGQAQSQILAGNVAASLQFGATGFVILQNGGSDGVPQVTPLGVQLSSGVNLTTESTATRRRRSHNHRRSAVAWVSTLKNVFKRQTTTSASTPLPSTVPTTAPAVLTGAFWTNTSASNTELVIIGGNFSFTSVSGATSLNVAIYDPTASTLTALKGSQVNGTVNSLLVQGDKLFVGGVFTLQNTNIQGLAIYDLAQQTWDTTGFQALQDTSGTVTVRSISTSDSESTTVIVAGSFTGTTSTTCRAICKYDTSSQQWSALGNGILGDVASISYANKGDDIVAAGSIQLADSTPANVAIFFNSNSSWAAVGDGNDLPGPVTAVTVNDENVDSIFAAGRSSDNTTSFLSFWNGQSWTAIGSALEGTTEVSQLRMVPLQNTHSANSVIESDRMLMVSGSLSDSSFGNVSTVLFDGETFFPYILSTSASGTPGSIAGLFSSVSSFSFTQHHFLATGIVILISIAISAGVVFLLALLGILWTLFSRRDDKLNKFDPDSVEDENDSTHRPSSLLEHINAATRAAALGSSPYGQYTTEKEVGTADAAATGENDPFGPDASNYVRSETPAVGGMIGAEESSRPAHARYSFDAAGEGELPLTAGQELEVLDDNDAAWWYARDTRTGKEGVVPAAYVY